MYMYSNFSQTEVHSKTYIYIRSQKKNKLIAGHIQTIYYS